METSLATWLNDEKITPAQVFLIPTLDIDRATNTARDLDNSSRAPCASRSRSSS